MGIPTGQFPGSERWALGRLRFLLGRPWGAHAPGGEGSPSLPRLTDPSPGEVPAAPAPVPGRRLHLCCVPPHRQAAHGCRRSPPITDAARPRTPSRPPVPHLEAGPGPHAPFSAGREHPAAWTPWEPPAPQDSGLSWFGPMVCTGRSHHSRPRTPAGGAPAALLSAQQPLCSRGTHTHAWMPRCMDTCTDTSMDTLSADTQAHMCGRAHTHSFAKCLAHHVGPETRRHARPCEGATPSLSPERPALRAKPELRQEVRGW